MKILNTRRSTSRAVDGGRTPLYWAACYGQLDVVRALLNAGADKTIANMHGGSKPIDVVCEWGDNKQHKDAIVALLR